MLITSIYILLLGAFIAWVIGTIIDFLTITPARAKAHC